MATQVNASKLECRDLYQDNLDCQEEYEEHNIGESLSSRCTSEMIDLYDCSYPAGTEQDKAVLNQMWEHNLA